MYGYHEREHQFFKIFFYNPAIIKKACSILENGAVLGKHLQPHESHINYVLQFMIDYNLHGMSYINLSTVKHRYDPKSMKNTPPDSILPPTIQKRSISQLEIDAFASDILNRNEINGELTVNPGLAALWEDERQRKRNNDLDSQISFCLTQNRKHVQPTKSHEYFRALLEEKLKMAVEKRDPELDKSAYPAETPESGSILSASSLNHSVLDDTVVESSPGLNDSEIPLLEVLFDLQENNQIENDSILSQQV